jgi:RNA polymerase sigma factor (sigma-70 family)
MLGEQFPYTLAAARTGAEWAWSTLYRDLAPSVLGYLRARGAGEPEDVTGEVFLQVVRYLPGFDGDERDFRAWVFVITHHRLLDERRRAQRRPVEPGGDLHVDGTAAGAEEEALRTISSDRVRELIGRLPREQRDVLLLRVLGGLTVAEVATAMGKSRGAVKALQRRGLQALERELQAQGVTL